MSRLAVMAGISLAAASSVAQADELQDLKSEIEALNSRMAAIEAAPMAPAGFRLIAIGEGELEETPGAPLTARERAAYAGRATVISVLPTADAPASASISWSGYMRAGVVYNGIDQNATSKAYVLQDGAWVRDPAKDKTPSKTTNDSDVGGRAQLLVQAKTDTSVGEVGVQLKLRDDVDGNGTADVYTKVAWGYWAMTPDVTLGGGYNQSIGDIVYGYDGSCTCYFTDNADVDFNPGDTTQVKLSYASGPVSFNVALEDASLDDNTISKGLLGVAADVVYAGDVFSGEIAGVWRDSNESQTGSSQIWQVGLGGSISMGDIGFFTFAAATGEGPYEVESSGTIVDGLAYNNTWWGASAFSSINLGSTSHMELAAGYKHRSGDQSTYTTKDKVTYDVSDVDYHTYALMGGLYYTPVNQLTLGLEGEWYTTDTSLTATHDVERRAIDDTTDTVWADVVAVWSF